MYVANYSSATLGEYTTSGSTVNTQLVSGLDGPIAVAASGNYLFVVNANSETVGKYTTSGATVNASLISGLGGPIDIAISGNDLFLANSGNNEVGEYTTSGATVNASLISGIDNPMSVAVGPVPPVLSSSGFFNGDFQMVVVGSVDQTYTVQMTTNMVSTNWVSLLATNSASGTFLFTDPKATNQARFYRVEIAQ